MDGFFARLEFWHWWILAALLAAVEAMLPGMFFIWFGAAAAIVGVVVLILPDMGWEWEWFSSRCWPRWRS
jgi:inner membrane protein